MSEVSKEIPTQEEYEKAKDSIKTLNEWRSAAARNVWEYIDHICKERDIMKDYDEIIEHHRETILRYEIYQEIQEEERVKKEERKKKQEKKEGENNV